MTRAFRGKSNLPHPGPYIGVITNHLDVTHMGMLEVSLIKGLPGDSDLQSQTFSVRYLSPFYGVTSVKFEGNDATKFDDVQKSYGMWMVPPDVGTQVLVIFIEGDPNQGYWMGCVMDMFQNHMVPGIAASRLSAVSTEQIKKYQTDLLPVAEMHKKSRNLTSPAPDKSYRPVHPFANRLLEQGLLLDTVRGVTTSGARRELPSQVFGISTPGPLDPTGTKAKIGYGEQGKRAPVSRLGGSTFVMDDGDIDGQNELVRLRTRTGHQILLHNTKDLVYISNARGTTWIELTSNGKIDIYAADSISIHSEQDLNFRADRNVNIEAGGSVNISSNQDFVIESRENINLLSGKDFAVESSNKFSLSSFASMDIKGKSSLSLESNGSIDIKSGDILKIGSDKNLNLTSSEDILQTSKNFHLKANSSGFITTGPGRSSLHINGAPAKTASNPSSANVVDVVPLKRYVLPNRSIDGSWENNFYKSTDILTIMTRIPTHEPYDQHESINPEQFSYINLDTSRTEGPSSQIIGGATKFIKDTFKLPPNQIGTPPASTGNAEQDNLQAFLWMIRYAEGTANSDGYRGQWPSQTFDIDDPTKRSYLYKDHPREVRTANGISSSAAGAYQFLTKTWDWCKDTLNLPDFSPASQDKAAIFLLGINNSLDNIKKGNFSQAVYQNRKTWASLPGANYPGQGMRAYTTLLQVYKSAGGKLA